MKTVLDFNGYFDSRNKFFIKEYSLYSLNRSGAKLKHSHEILSPPTANLNDLDRMTRESYLRYYQKYKIKWTAHTYHTGGRQPKLPDSRLKSNIIFIADHQKERLFYQYLKSCFPKEGLHYNFLKLEDLGYKADHEKESACSYHDDPNFDHCAHDNVMDMVKFIRANNLFSYHKLKRIHIAIDFNFYGNNYLGIKELSIINIGYDGNMVSKKPEVTRQTSQSEPSQYKRYYEVYGIKWIAGNKKFKHLRYALSKTLDHALFVYVKNKVLKKILCEVNISAQNKIVCLEEFGYNASNFELTKTSCEWHDDPPKNNCACDNAGFMANWLVGNGLYSKSKRDDLMQNPIQIDNGPFATSSAGRTRLYCSRQQTLDPVVYVDSSPSSDGDNENQSAAQFYESFESRLSKSLPTNRQSVDIISLDNEDDDPDVTEYLDKNDPRFLMFDPEVFDLATDDLVPRNDEVDGDEFDLERLLSDGKNNPEIMDDFDADTFEELFFTQ